MQSKRLSNAILITSGKGGVGKTWFSLNLAHALSVQQRKVLFFDGDLGLSNIDVQLGLETPFDLGGVLNKTCSFEEAIYPYKPTKGLLPPIDIITGKTVDGVFTTVSHEGVLELKDSLTKVAPSYDHMILDLSAGLDRIIVEFSTFAQNGIVLVTNEPTSLSDAFAFIKVSSQRNPDLPLHIVVNKVDSTEQGLEIYTKLVHVCKHFLKTIPPLIGIIHRDPSVPLSIQQKTPILTGHPTSQVAQDIDNIATNLINLGKPRFLRQQKRKSTRRNYRE